MHLLDLMTFPKSKKIFRIYPCESGIACRAPQKPTAAPKTARGNEGPQRQGSRFLRAFSSKQLKDTLPTVAPETAARVRSPPDAAKLDEGFTSPHQVLDDER